MKSNISFLFLTALFLFGCANEWRAEQPIKPTTYRLPAYRSEQSVGNLRKLAVLPARIRRVGTFSIANQDERWEAGLAYDAAGYLSREKGYDAVAVVDDNGAWRPEWIVKTEYGPIENLQEIWEAAASEEDVAAAVSTIGRALNVDGVVSTWLEEYDPGSTAGGALWGMTNIFLLNAPLMYMIMHTNAEAVIYETYSGQPIWRSKLSGDVERKIQPSVVRAFFENLENAIPARLAK
jgi:hypothetical protein